MNLRLFFHAASSVVTGDSSRYDAQGVARMAQQMAEMVGWAQGPIDLNGELHARLDQLRQSARVRYEAAKQPGMASLHDAIADLMDAVARHDRDLCGEGAAEDDAVGF